MDSLDSCRGIIEHTALPAELSASLRHQAKKRATYYSIEVEGNWHRARQYQRALDYLSLAKSKNLPLSEDFIKKINALVSAAGLLGWIGRSSYRGPALPGVLYALWDKETKDPVYIPPSYTDVPVLMRDLVHWYHSKEAKDLPAPVKAAVFAYQMVTIHPFKDGNGRTARAAASYILMGSGYDLGGFYLIEEHFGSDLKSYYACLQMGLPADYYEGRNNADMTPWIIFFLESINKGYMSLLKKIQAQLPWHSCVKVKYL